MGYSQKELEDIKINVEAGIENHDFGPFLEYCDIHVWRRLGNLSSMYGELVRECSRRKGDRFIYRFMMMLTENS